jgi:hypothetical protein
VAAVLNQLSDSSPRSVSACFDLANRSAATGALYYPYYGSTRPDTRPSVTNIAHTITRHGKAPTTHDDVGAPVRSFYGRNNISVVELKELKISQTSNSLGGNDSCFW